ncbi:hypothetical protein ACOMHN_000872 [Nucella lapillus]
MGATLLLPLLLLLELTILAQPVMTAPLVPTTSVLDTAAPEALPTQPFTEDSTSTDTSQENNQTSDYVDSTPSRLARCQYEYSESVRDGLYEVGGENVPMQPKRFILPVNETRCYIRRQDLESKLNASTSGEIIVIFVFGCRNPVGTDIVFLEDEEAEDLEASYAVSDNNGSYSSREREARYDQWRVNNQSSGYHWYEHVVSYYQSMNCRANFKGADMVANMSDLRVLSAIGPRPLNLSELQEQPALCRLFRNMVAFGIMQDWTAQTHLHHLAACADHLHKVVEMDFTNDSLTSFPREIQAAVPNLRALALIDNNLTAPVEYPWPPGFATLPRNLSRRYLFNLGYSFDASFDMPPNLFRRIFVLDGNQITNLTHFQFHSQFQYISVQQNGLREIAAGVFDNVTSLQFLSLADNELDSLPVNLFDRLSNLKRLDLQGNRLVTLSTDIFRHVRKLERLNLERNLLQLIQGGLFTRLEELTEVKLKDNSIVEVKKEAFTTQSVKLQLLELQNNPLKTFPVVVLLLRGLVITSLDYTDIEVLDFVDISRQTSLSILSGILKNPTTGKFFDLKENPDSQKIISFKHSKLRSVVAYNATRETLPIFLLVIKYYTIQLEGSRLACDCHILNVTHQLQRWEMDGTLTGQEACLGGWKCVWPSELSGKLVSTLKDEDTYCPLGAPGNTSCPQGCTCYLRTKVNTVIVDCQNGGLTSLPESVPANTRELWLQNNTIQSLDRRPYLAHLTSLKLTSNNVQDLPIGVLLHMPLLSILHLDDNWLTGLKPDFAKLRQLKDLRLAGNPFRCDCNTAWLKEWILGHQMITKDWMAIKCTTADDDGQVFASVPDDQFVCKVSASLSQLAVPIAIPVSFALFFLTAGVVAFIQRRRLKVLLYIHTGYHPFDRDPPDERALYDVSVVCDVTACAWVLRHVVETLEEGGRYKVFFYSRDAYAGFTIAENVRHCVKNSRRVVVVVGKEWEDREVVVTAVHEALARCHKDMPHFLTLLLHDLSAKDIDNKDLWQYIHGGRYIPTDDKHFAKKLLYEMPHVKQAKKGHDKAAAGNPKKAAPAGPEPIALYDILAVRGNEQDNRAEEDENIPDGEMGYIRQVSQHEVDVDLRLSGMEQNNRRNHQNQDNNGGNDGDGNDDYDDDGADDIDGVDDNDGADDNNVEDNEGRHRRAQENGDNAVLHPAGLQNQMSVESQRSQQLKTIFVWYADDDLEYTLKNIVNPLEQRGHTCILQDRDFPLGAAIQENIVHAAENSTRCIFVLSDQTAENDWFNFAFHVAFDRHLQSRDHRVALVSREEVDVTRFSDEVQQVIRTSSVLQEADPWFWKRLKTFVCLDQVELC